MILSRIMNVCLFLIFITSMLMSGACAPTPGPPPNPGPGTPVTTPPDPYLSAVYVKGSDVLLKETTSLQPSTGEFNDSVSSTLHTLEENADVDSRASTTLHSGSQWVAWREGNIIYARAIWWGPGNTRVVFDGGGQTPTCPAIASFNDKLVVVFGIDDTFYFTTSDWGVEWTTPIPKLFAGAIVNNPALAAYGNRLYVGAVFGWALFTIGINADFTWGPNFRAMTLQEPILPELTLAANADQLSIGFARGGRLLVTHSPTGYHNWSTPVEIASRNTDYGAPPALAYFNQHLYAVFHSGVRLFGKRSTDGVSWTAPVFEVDSSASGNLAAASLVGSDYSVQPPEPQVVTLNDSGIAPANTLNLVFISEGYLESELTDYQDLVDRVSNTFRIVNPFSKHLDKFNKYRIDLPSREKGADASPAISACIRQGVFRPNGYQSPVPGFEARYTDTALGSHYRSCWPNHNNPDNSQTQSSPNNAITPLCDAAEDVQNQHVDMTSQKQLHIFGFYAYDMVEQWIPGFDRSRDLLYVITNHIPEDGATDKASFNPVVTTPDFAEGLTNVHEIAHFTTALDDEDFSSCIGGTQTDCMYSANKTANGNILDPAHKWAHHFVFQGRPGDSIVADPVSRPPDWMNFWDPATINAADIFNAGLWATNGITDWNGGDIIYGPSQQCLMNHTGGNTRFCPICTEEVTRELFVRAGMAFVVADYQNVYDGVFLEFKHTELGIPSPSKTGFISVNGNIAAETDFTCHYVLDAELCSVNITNYVINGTNQLKFVAQSPPRAVDMLSIQVVNSNGAPLHLFPVTDVSGIGQAYYFSQYYWPGNSDLDFEFDAQLTP